jgi:hypothetical protein
VEQAPSAVRISSVPICPPCSSVSPW